MAGFGSIIPASALLGGLSAFPQLRKASPPSVAKAGARAPSKPAFSFKDVAIEAGLGAALNVYGGVASKRYILEETGCGVSLFDYDNDGWLDIFMVNGTRFEGISPSHQPTNFLFHNNRDGTFTDVTEKAGLARSGW